ncbi:MAG: energy transducer TonB [Spirochaetes bacterium]|nr:energy transducer TonB [Spirochaetota bacterium]
MDNFAFTHISSLRQRISNWQNRHPYQFSAIISTVIMLFILFYAPPIEITEEDIVPVDSIVFLDFEELKVNVAKRVAKREISSTASDSASFRDDVERAQGTSDDPNAVDLAFLPNVVPPRPIGKLKKFYPQIAREKGVEATIHVELLIASNGKVKAVTILSIRLSKTLPADEYSLIAKAFARDAVKMLQEARFSPPVVQGKNVPVKFEMPLRFRLED